MATKKAPAKKPAPSGKKIGGGVKNASTPKGKAPGGAPTKRTATKKRKS